MDLVGSHLGSIFSIIESIKILYGTIYLCSFIFSRGNYNDVHEKYINTDIILIYSWYNINSIFRGGLSYLKYQHLRLLSRSSVVCMKSQACKTNFHKLTCCFLTQSIGSFTGKQSIYTSIRWYSYSEYLYTLWRTKHLQIDKLEILLRRSVYAQAYKQAFINRYVSNIIVCNNFIFSDFSLRKTYAATS